MTDGTRASYRAAKARAVAAVALYRPAPMKRTFTRHLPGRARCCVTRNGWFAFFETRWRVRHLPFILIWNITWTLPPGGVGAMTRPVTRRISPLPRTATRSRTGCSELRSPRLTWVTLTVCEETFPMLSEARTLTVCVPYGRLAAPCQSIDTDLPPWIFAPLKPVTFLP